jgi:hypothetical protein
MSDKQRAQMMRHFLLSLRMINGWGKKGQLRESENEGKGGSFTEG